VPFAQRSTNGEARYDQIFTTISVEFNAQIDVAKFAMPAPPPPDFAITGGANILTPTAAATLGLKTEGALQGRGVGEKSEDVALTRVDSLALGDVSLSSQVFAIFPMESFSSVEGVAVDGLVGHEI